MGYPQIPVTGWVIDHTTVFTPGQGIPGGVYQSLFLQGSQNTVTNSIFYGGQIYLPDGLAGVTGNCQWHTNGSTTALGGQVVDPRFMTDVSGYDYHTPLTTIAQANFALQSGSPCAGSGSSISSVGSFLQMVAQNASISSTPTAPHNGTASPSPTSTAPHNGAVSPTPNMTVSPTLSTIKNNPEQLSIPTRLSDNPLWLVAGGGFFLGVPVLFWLFYQKWRKRKK